MVCTKCKIDKFPDDFWKDNSRPNRISAWCKTCKRDDQRRIRESDPQKHREREKSRYWSNRDYERERHTVRKYGITLGLYNEMLLLHDSKCAICGEKEPKRKTFDIDHDHETGKVIGLLCTRCNMMLGYSKDNPENLISGAKYLLSRK